MPNRLYTVTIVYDQPELMGLRCSDLRGHQFVLQPSLVKDIPLALRRTHNGSVRDTNTRDCHTDTVLTGNRSQLCSDQITGSSRLISENERQVVRREEHHR